jgi:OmcA/MtrC family decaheme c-type cytochrome
MYMRIPSSIFAVGRYALALVVVAGSVVLVSATKKTEFTIHDKEYYAAANTVNFVRPGLAIKIVSAGIATDGTITVDFKLTDPKGLPLDINGVTTPGTMSVRYLIAYIPKGQTQFVSYFTRTSTNATTGKSAIQATGDTGGTVKQVADGEYIYTFAGKAPANWDKTATHRLGIYGSRNLTEFDLGTNYDDDVITWVPAGGAPAPRDVVRTASCNKCHDQLAFHGGSRRSLELCIMCHTPQTGDPNGNTADMKVMAHKIHQGRALPSVVAGTPYVIGSLDASSIGNPSNASQTDPDGKSASMPRCTFCHESNTGAAQANNWFTNPTRDACGSCHDDVNFATGKNHVNLPQANDNQCAQCHIPQGELEFDASIKGAHTVAIESTANPGLVLGITKVDNGQAGKAPTVTFTAKDFKGNPVTVSQMSRLSIVLAGPASDYGYTSFGSDVTTPGYVSENALSTAKCDGSGTCTYTFTHAIPAKATGTYSVGVEGRRVFTVLPNTTLQHNYNYDANNFVAYFSVDGSKLAQRRTVVDTAKCTSCHARFSLHGGSRNQVQHCVLCHNPSQTDSGNRVNATVAADKALPPQSVNFALLVHKIHTGEKLAAAGLSYIVVGNGGSHNDFSDILYPTMSDTGSTGDTAKCYMCHVQTPAPTEAIFPIGKNNVVDPQGLLSSAPATTSACTACHFTRSAMAHSVSQTDPKFGESCDVCHATGTDFDVDKEHAGKQRR